MDDDRQRRGQARYQPRPLEKHKQWLLDLVAAEPDLTLKEIRARLHAQKTQKAGIGSIWRFYDRHQITFKKNSARRRAGSTCCGYEDAIDHNRLRDDPLLKMAAGRCPESGAALASQSTITRFENAPSKTDALRLARALIDWFAKHVSPSFRDIFDIDDSFDAAHGGQQGTFWNGHHDERGYTPMHIFHAGCGLPVATILRPAKTPGGEEVRTVIKHVTRRLAAAL